MEQIANVIRLMAELRNCAKTSLPMSDSLIAYDLILYIAITYKEKTPITIKQLFSALPHSYTAVRHHYKRLLNDGYVEHRLDENDRRVKFIEPTEKFIDSLVSYANNVKAILDTPPLQHSEVTLA